MPLSELWRHDCDAQSDFTHSVVSGTITYASGYCQLACVNTNNAGWDGATHRGPIAYKTPLPDDEEHMLQLTAKCIYYTSNDYGTNHDTGCGFYKDRDNAFGACIWKTAATTYKLKIWRLLANTNVDVALITLGSTTPQVDPLFIKMLYDPVYRTVQVWYKGCGAADWTLGTDFYSLGFTPIACMLYTRNYGYYGVTGRWDYMQIEEFDAPPRFREGEIDSNGLSVQRSRNISDVILIDTTQGRFGVGGGSGFTAGGIAYLKGSVAGVGMWRDSHSASWRCAPAPTATTPTLSNNGSEIVISCGATAGASFPGKEAGRVISNPLWVLQGDFDIQVRFSELTHTADGIAFLLGVAKVVGGKEGGSWYAVNGSTGRGGWVNASIEGMKAGVWGAGGTSDPIAVDNKGYLRLKRTGTTFYSYDKHNLGDGWTSITRSDYPADQDVGNSDVYVFLSMQACLNAAGSVKFDEFTINGGQVITSYGWPNEAAGIHRGPLGAMPPLLVGVLGFNEVNLINPADNTLWARFLRGTNLAIFDNNSAYPRKLDWDNGKLLIANGSPDSTTDNGGLIVVDFTTDNIFLQRPAATTYSGSTWRGNSAGDAERVGGSIKLRNTSPGSFGYGGDVASLGTTACRTYGCAALDYGGYEIRAAATSSGVSVTRRSQSCLSGSCEDGLTATWDAATSTKFVYLDTNGDLYWVTAANVYHIAYATWVASLGSTFTADKTLALPGTRVAESQYRLTVTSGSIVWMAANEGVYRSNALAAFELWLGEEGSGARNETLQDYDRVSCLISRTEDEETYLIVACLDGTTTLLYTIDLEDGSIVQYTDISTMLDFSEATAVA